MAKKKIKPATNLIEIVDDLDETEKEWDDMPEFKQLDNGAFRQIIVSFDDKEGVAKFAKAIGQSLTDKTRSVWYPPRERNNVNDLFWVDEGNDGSE